MQLIGQNKFVIETKQPTGKFKNKTIMSDEGPVIVPDGEPEYEYMWFAGIGIHPNNPKLMGAVWTPYPEQAARYKDADEAMIILMKIIGPDGGGSVISWETCHKKEGRQIIVPIDASVIAGKTLDGIHGTNL